MCLAEPHSDSPRSLRYEITNRSRHLTSSSAWRRRNPERWEFQVCNHGCRHFAGTRLTQSSWSVADWRCQTAVTPILHRIRALCCFCHGASGRLQRIRSYRRACSGRRARDEPFGDSRSPRRRFGYCLVTVGGLAASDGRSESAPFRPDLIAV